MDKVDNEVQATESEKLIKILYQAKDVVPVVTVITTIVLSEEVSKIRKENNSEVREDKKTPKTKKETKRPHTVPQPQVSTGGFSTANTNTFFSPLVIKIAKEYHISFEELARIPATGKDDRLDRKSVV